MRHLRSSHVELHKVRLVGTWINGWINGENYWMELGGLEVRNLGNISRQGYARSLKGKRIEWDGESQAHGGAG